MCQPQHTRAPFEFPFQAWEEEKGPQVDERSGSNHERNVWGIGKYLNMNYLRQRF